MASSSTWKAKALLTWFLAAEAVNCLPNPVLGTAAEEILQRTAAQPERAFKTQYPPSNAEERLLIPDPSPVRFDMENNKE